METGFIHAGGMRNVLFIKSFRVYLRYARDSVCVIQYPHSCKFSARFLHTSSHAGNIAGTARDGFADDMSLHLFIGLHTLRQRYAECLN